MIAIFVADAVFDFCGVPTVDRRLGVNQLFGHPPVDCIALTVRWAIVTDEVVTGVDFRLATFLVVVSRGQCVLTNLQTTTQGTNGCAVVSI